MKNPSFVEIVSPPPQRARRAGSRDGAGFGEALRRAQPAPGAGAGRGSGAGRELVRRTDREPRRHAPLEGGAQGRWALRGESRTHQGHARTEREPESWGIRRPSKPGRWAPGHPGVVSYSWRRIAPLPTPIATRVWPMVACSLIRLTRRVARMARRAMSLGECKPATSRGLAAVLKVECDISEPELRMSQMLDLRIEQDADGQRYASTTASATRRRWR